MSPVEKLLRRTAASLHSLLIISVGGRLTTALAGVNTLLMPSCNPRPGRLGFAVTIMRTSGFSWKADRAGFQLRAS